MVGQSDTRTGLEEKIRRQIDPATSKDTPRGRRFWILLTAAFLLCLAGFILVVTMKLFDFFGPGKKSDVQAGPGPSISSTGPTEGGVAAGPGPGVEKAGSGGDIERRPSGGPDEKPRTPAASSYQAGDIFQDSDGVWRNRPGDSVTATSRVAPPRGFYQNEAGVWQNRPEEPARSSLTSLGLEGAIPGLALDLLGGALGVDGEELAQFNELFQGLNLDRLTEASGRPAAPFTSMPSPIGPSRPSPASAANPGLSLEGYEHFNPDSYEGPNLFDSAK